MQDPAAYTPSPKAVLLRFGAVVAASGPVILTTFGVGRQSVGWFCSSAAPAPYSMEGPYELEGPYSLAGPYGLGVYAPDDLPGELLFWAVLLLPIAVAGLVLNGSRRATLTAVAAIATVLAYGLVVAFLLPGPDPCTGREHTVAPPWLLIISYPMAAGALFLAARSPLPRRKYGMIFWAGAAVAAGWAAMFHRLPATYDRFLGAVYVAEASSWDGLAWWSSDADTIGLPVVIVAMAAAATATAPTLWKRTVGIATAAALLFFVLLDIVTYLSRESDPFGLLFADSVRWRLLLAAVLVTLAAWHPQVRISWVGTVHLARSIIRGQLKGLISSRTRDVAVAIMIVAGAIWLIVSSFTPSR
ncbi:hypothetical protein [Nonomuraea sp. NPDC005650]|uniref:hypothetical protein n=1 Tax=Nonomuraea sp. NPDC005650 TaxID=3157045 RepID=UPI0033A86467